MRIKAMFGLILCVIIGLTTADESLDLKSVLLQILNKAKMKSQTETFTGITLDTSHDATSSDKNSVMKGAIEQILAEIAFLETKYGNELKLSENRADLWSQTFGNINGDQDKDNDYKMLVGKMKTVAHKLLLLRLKLATDFGIDEDGIQSDINKPTEESKPEEENLIQDQSTSYRLMKILENIVNNKEKQAEILHEKETASEHTKDKLKHVLDTLKQQNVYPEVGNAKPLQTIGHVQKQQAEGVSGTTNITERSWHSRNCAHLMDRCMGWFPDCCDNHEFKKGMKFPLCCSFHNNKSKNIKGEPGICVPNLGGRRSCEEF